MVKKVIIARKVQIFADSLEFLQKYEAIAFEKFQNDSLIQSACLFHMEKMIQALLDLIMHIISDAGWGVHLHGAGIADLLLKKKVINATERDSLIKIHGFRNRLVHEYEELDLRIAYDILNSKKDETRNLLDKILKFIGY